MEKYKIEDDRFIAISIVCKSRVNFDIKIKDILDSADVLFNPREAHLFGARVADFGHYLQIAIYNPRFDIVADCDPVPIYTVEGAKEKFPFLFRE